MNLRKIWSPLDLLFLLSVAAFSIGVASTASAGDVEALYKAAGDGDSAEVTALLDAGVDVNGRTGTGSYALNNAAVENEVEVMKILLAGGANPNVQNLQGDTPLICATKYAGGKPATVKLLLEAGTDSTIKDDDGNTALDYAEKKGQKEAVAMLEKSGD